MNPRSAASELALSATLLNSRSATAFRSSTLRYTLTAANAIAAIYTRMQIAATTEEAAKPPASPDCSLPA